MQGLRVYYQPEGTDTEGTEAPPTITIDNYELELVNQFTYLEFTISRNLSLDTEIDKGIEKSAFTLARLTT